jgi:PTH1 family peptidyl-tRNA hydrolase
MLTRLRGKRRNGSPVEGELFLIVGLGNPGRRYERTRHNLGFMTIDRLAERMPAGVERSRFQAVYADTRDGEKRVVLAKPQTFMNESGVAVTQLARWLKIPRDRLLVIYDELDLPFGTIRLRADGSAGGHNGVQSVIDHLHTKDFARLRIGINRPVSGSTVPYVLSRFTQHEQREVPGIVDRAVDAALSWLRDGVTAAMNEHNRRPSNSMSRGPDSLPDKPALADNPESGRGSPANQTRDATNPKPPGCL